MRPIASRGAVFIPVILALAPALAGCCSVESVNEDSNRYTLYLVSASAWFDRAMARETDEMVKQELSRLQSDFLIALTVALCDPVRPNPPSYMRHYVDNCYAIQQQAFDLLAKRPQARQ